MNELSSYLHLCLYHRPDIQRLQRVCRWVHQEVLRYVVHGPSLAAVHAKSAHQAAAAAWELRRPQGTFQSGRIIVLRILLIQDE